MKHINGGKMNNLFTEFQQINIQSLITVWWAIGFYIILAVANIGLIAKANDKWWKGIIPIYNSYTICKLTWHVKFFWIQLSSWLILILSFFICASINNVEIFFTILIIFGLFLLILFIVGNYRLSVSYGHGIGFTLGLTMLSYIFIIILAFGKSEYLGNLYKKNKNI